MRSSKKRKNSSNIWVILSAISGILLLIFHVLKSRGKGFKPDFDSTILRELKGSRYEALAPYIIAQSRHETDNYNSNVFKRANNLFGMKKPRMRATTAKDQFGEYAAYMNPNDSVQDLIYWFNNSRFPFTVGSLGNYVRALHQRKYFEDTFDNYYNGLKRFL